MTMQNVLSKPRAAVKYDCNVLHHLVDRQRGQIVEIDVDGDA